MPITLPTQRHHADGSVSSGSITIEPNNATRRARPVILSGATLLSRLTDAEYVAIRQAAVAGLNNAAPQLERWLDNVRANGNVEGSAARELLLSAGLLTPERAAVVLAG